MSWTKEQLGAIKSRGKNLIVSAGAGSGKTKVMIERICELLGEGADIRRMAVCTFTKAAATEMKSRLIARLNEILAQKKDAHLLKQLGYLPSAEISTLHSWCAHIMRAWFFCEDIDPEFSVMEDGEEAALKDDAAEAVIAEGKEKGDPDFVALYTVFASGRTHRRLKETLLEIYDYARARPGYESWLKTSAKMTDAQYRKVLFEKADKDAAKLLGTAETLKADMAAAKFGLDYNAVCELIDCIKSGGETLIPTPTLRGKPEFKELHERFKELKGAYTDICRKKSKIVAMPSHESSLPFCKTLSDLALKLDKVYSAYKKEREKADYSDLEHKALAILDGACGAEIAAGYDYVFVDEYQDISPLQEELLRKFTGGMFFVGDIKQSIYGFRMCSPEYFIAKYNSYKSGAGEAVELTSNFRSGREILDVVNEVFSSVMTDDFGGVNYSENMFCAGRDLSAAVKAVIIESDAEKQTAEPAVYSVKNDASGRVNAELDCETDMVVDEIISMLKSKISEDGEVRDVMFGDIAVLVRSRGAFTDLLEKKLRAASIPVCAVLSDTAADSFESVQSLMAIFAIINNSHDDVNLAAVMASPMFGDFSADELAELKAPDKTFCDSVFEAAERGKKSANTQPDFDIAAEIAAMRKSRDVNEKAGYFINILSGLRGISHSLTVAEIAGEITAKFDCFNYALRLGGEREAAALDAFSEHLAAQTEHNTLYDYLRHINRVGLPRLKANDGGNAVRIMTIHASKGLEFPFVILPNLHKKFNLRDTHASVICDGEEGIVLRSFDLSERSINENPRYAVCSERLRRKLTEEELRILYVAMTRAQYRLSMYCLAPSREREEDDSVAYSDWLYPVIKKFAEVRKLSEYKCEYPPAPKPASHAPDCGTVQKLKANFGYCYGSGHGAVKVSVSGVARSADDTEYAAADFFAKTGENDDRAAERGSAYHKFMQWADFGRDGEWERLCARFPEQAELINRAEMERAFADMRKFIAGREFFREKAFVMRLPAMEAGQAGESDVLLQGVIDLLVLNSDGSADIVDYKTGSEEHLHCETYKRQLGWYKTAAERILNFKVNGAYLYGFTCGKFIKTEL